MKHFLRNYPGPRGRHLSCLTYFSQTGKPFIESEGFSGGTKRPGRKAYGRAYDPHARIDRSTGETYYVR